MTLEEYRAELQKLAQAHRNDASAMRTTGHPDHANCASARADAFDRALRLTDSIIDPRRGRYACEQCGGTGIQEP